MVAVREKEEQAARAAGEGHVAEALRPGNRKARKQPQTQQAEAEAEEEMVAWVRKSSGRAEKVGGSDASEA